MENFKTWLLVNLAIFIGIVPDIEAQQSVKFQASESKLEITGTSNLHDWEELVNSFDVELVVVTENNAIQGISKVVFNCKSASVESDNSIMTGKTHDALKVEKYPDIRFIQTSVGDFKNQNGKLSGTISGELVLAGVTKKVTLPFNGTTASGKLNINGSKKLKMSDYNISPPTAMFGSLKTGDEVELVYSLHFILD